MKISSGRRRPHPAEANLEAADEIQPFVEHRAFLERAVAVYVFENENAVRAFPFELLFRIGVGLGDPEPAAFIDGESDRLLHVGFRRDQSA